MNPTQPQALCYDPDIFVNWQAEPLDWTVDDEALAEAYPNLIETDNLAYAELPVEYHVAIQEMVWKDDGFGETSVPCPWGSHENDGWGLRSNGTGIRKNGENDFTFHCFKCPKPNQSKRYSEKPNPPRDSNAPLTLIRLPRYRESPYSQFCSAYRDTRIPFVSAFFYRGTSCGAGCIISLS